MENEKYEKTEPQFKIGQKVYITNSFRYNGYFFGGYVSEYKIVGIKNDHKYPAFPLYQLESKDGHSKTEWETKIIVSKKEAYDILFDGMDDSMKKLETEKEEILDMIEKLKKNIEHTRKDYKA